jgi:anti-sigma B factor antagonist
LIDTLTVETQQGDGFAILKCRGRLVAGSCGLLYDEVRRLLPDTKRIIVDLAGLTQVDSMGLATIVRAYVSAKSDGSCVELMNVGAKIRELLKITHLVSVFSIIGENGIRLH